MASKARCMGDQQGLYHAPCPVDAVKWSEDNLIAVVSGHTAVIASPADITGPRAFISIDTALNPVQLDCKPKEHEDSVSLGLACLAEAGTAIVNPRTIRAVCWSPAGCGATGTCLLTIVTSDGKVGPQKSLQLLDSAVVFTSSALTCDNAKQPARTTAAQV